MVILFERRWYISIWGINFFRTLGMERNFIRKGDAMHKKRVLTLAILSIPIFLITALGNAWAELKVGDEAPAFVLPSSQDKLVDYYKDYYGKHHLIITFFPAAFTPI
jgi:hypothetical protein